MSLFAAESMTRDKTKKPSCLMFGTPPPALREKAKSFHGMAGIAVYEWNYRY